MTYFGTDAELDNLQHMLDPCNPMNLLLDELRKDWLEASVRFWCCDVAF
jgi:hypothetical protein